MAPTVTLNFQKPIKKQLVHLIGLFVIQIEKTKTVTEVFC